MSATFLPRASATSTSVDLPPPPTGLWGAWGFEAAAGDTAFDSSGFENHGELEAGAARNPAGYFGQGLETNGINGNVDLGIAWVRDAAEYRAASLQAYGVAAASLDDKVADATWSALPGQSGAELLPPAVILDVDETAVSNAHFQAALVPPFRESKLANGGEVLTMVSPDDLVEISTRFPDTKWGDDGVHTVPVTSERTSCATAFSYLLSVQKRQFHTGGRRRASA